MVEVPTLIDHMRGLKSANVRDAVIEWIGLNDSNPSDVAEIGREIIYQSISAHFVTTTEVALWLTERKKSGKAETLSEFAVRERERPTK